MAKRIELSGRRFGRLTVIEQHGRFGAQLGWLCRCDCGRFTRICGYSLRTGKTQSCGCLRIETVIKSLTTHGHTAGGSWSPEYSVWASVISRCTNPKNKKYFGRGIRVCDRWRESFEAFLEDMGSRPSLEHSIERIDTYGNYEPGNCRWATVYEQSGNKRNTRRIEHNGLCLTIPEWARTLGNIQAISMYTTLYKFGEDRVRQMLDRAIARKAAAQI